MKRTYIIVISIVVIGILIGVYIYLSNRPPEEPPEIVTRMRQIEIDRYESEEIEKIVLESDERTLTLYREEDEWKADYPFPVDLNENAMDDVLIAFTRLYADKVIEENPEDLEPYGLKDPVQTATAFLKDGSEKQYFLGNETPTGNTYYLMKSGETKIYTVWMNIGQHFSTVLANIREKKLPALNYDIIEYFKLVREPLPTIEVIRDRELSKGRSLSLSILMQPYALRRGLDYEEYTKVITQVGAIEIENFVTDNPSDLSEYGLDKPKYEVEIRDDQKVGFHLFFGNEANEKETYFKFADIPSILTVRTDKLGFMSVEPFTLIDKFAFILFLDIVEKVIVEIRDNTYVLEIERETKKVKDSEGNDVPLTAGSRYLIHQGDPSAPGGQQTIGSGTDAIASWDKLPDGAAVSIYHADTDGNGADDDRCSTCGKPAIGYLNNDQCPHEDCGAAIAPIDRWRVFPVVFTNKGRATYATPTGLSDPGHITFKIYSRERPHDANLWRYVRLYRNTGRAAIAHKLSDLN